MGGGGGGRSGGSVGGGVQVGQFGVVGGGGGAQAPVWSKLTSANKQKHMHTENDKQRRYASLGRDVA